MAQSKDKSNGMPADTPVPKAVVSRLSLYLRELQHLVRDGQETTSSTQLGNVLGFTDAQVRKDLAYFGQFGYPGIGYRCEELIHEIKRILGTDRSWPVAMVGAGNLGRALVGYKGFGQQGFRVAAVFDIDASKIGREIDGVTIYGLDQISQVVAEKGIRLAILAVPASAAQEVAEKLTEAGIDGILNFAPVTIGSSERINTVGVDLAIELEQLSFAVVNRANKS
ncbi:MAG: redox-sensing transcriptional repressor Rex [Pirellulaceae bacterium]